MIGYGGKLKKLRLEKNITMEQAAKVVGVAKSSYAGYESEFRQPSLEKLSQFASFYGVSVDYILGLTDKRDRESVSLNAKDLLTSRDLHWDGVPLSEEELKPIRDLLELVAERQLIRKNKNMG
ncbi:helix-turn-helix transcriptional regulator [Bacillus timonensis]|nr:helix-turn-helix transcriptional regulator [Bacillus timonensis]